MRRVSKKSILLGIYLGLIFFLSRTFTSFRLTEKGHSDTDTYSVVQSARESSKSRNSPTLFNRPDISPTDPELLSFIKLHNLKAPPTEKYSLQNPQAIEIKDDILNALRFAGYSDEQSGIFIEAGANDGIQWSNTLYLELNRNWTGLLVEASPTYYKKLEKTRRNAWISNVCLSAIPEQIEFFKSIGKEDWASGNGKINWEGKYDPPLPENGKKYDHQLKTSYVSEGLVNCFPLYSLLKALDMTKIDLFSLDVEGHEFKVLQGIPFDKVDIRVIIIEHWLAPEGKLVIRSFLEENGYKLYKEHVDNYFFVKSSA